MILLVAILCGVCWVLGMVMGLGLARAAGRVDRRGGYVEIPPWVHDPGWRPPPTPAKPAYPTYAGGTYGDRPAA